jgi:xylan 1,4-beta-xylosidase
VQLTVAGLPGASREVRLQHFRIDAEHSNAHTAWQRMGAPRAPTGAQRAQLERASELEAMPGPSTVKVSGSAAALTFTLPRQGVSLLVAEM